MSRDEICTRDEMREVTPRSRLGTMREMGGGVETGNTPRFSPGGQGDDEGWAEDGT